MTFLAILLIALSVPLFKIGFFALRDKANHTEYGVESEALHAVFSWLFIILAAVLASAGGVLLAG